MSVSRGYEQLKRMRGETSNPLIDELKRVIQHNFENAGRMVTVQIASDMVSKGLSLFLKTSETPKAWIYLARKEIPGFIPLNVAAELNKTGWQIENDVYGAEFALVSKALVSSDPAEQAVELATGLELLGAPQKRKWVLEAEYF